LPDQDDLSFVQYYTHILFGWAFDPKLSQMMKTARPQAENCQAKREYTDWILHYLDSFFSMMNRCSREANLRLIQILNPEKELELRILINLDPTIIKYSVEMKPVNFKNIK
jgi:hypothetical protein